MTHYQTKPPIYVDEDGEEYVIRRSILEVNEMYIKFVDDEDLRGIIKVDVDVVLLERIKTLAKKYRETSETHFIEDFYLILQANNINFEIIDLQEADTIHIE